MADVLFVGILIGFFGLAALFVVACDRIIGPDVQSSDEAPERSPEAIKERAVV